MTFDIREFTEKLTFVSGQKYICPVCGNNNLSIEAKTGKYQCWNGCENKDIREAVSPLIKKEVRPAAITQYVYLDKDGRPCARVSRSDNGYGKKSFYQSSWNETTCDWERGLTDAARRNLTIYRYQEVREAIAEGKQIFLVEGESVVDCLLELGISATTFIGGGGKYRKYVSPEVYQEALAGAEIILCPDRDKPGLRHMEEIFQDFPQAKWLYAPPSDFYWTHLPERGGLDLKDWILGGATAEQILEAIEDRRLIVDGLERSLHKTEGEPAKPAAAKSKMLQHFNLLDSQWHNRLRLNEMTQKIELDGSPIKMDRASLKIAREFDTDMQQEKAVAIINEIAEENSYSPVREYLESIAAVADPVSLDNLAERYFGTSDRLQQVLLKRTLIAAVARVFEPGCKVDTLTILQGGQGAMKSTFWRTLTGDKWFTDNLNDANEKDEKLKLRRYWILEFSEFETAYKRKEVEALKAFLSSQVDSLRRPYAREVEDFPRTSIFVGTTNRQEFLHDPTGERRYWVIRVSKQIPIEQLWDERDRIWAAAVHLYRAGEQWWLTAEEDALLAQANQDWQSNDSWETPILDYIQNRDRCTISEILTNAIKIELSNQGKAEQMRVSDIIRRHGWQKSPRQKRFDGRPQWFWEKTCVTTSEMVTQVVREVVTPSNPLVELVTDEASPPLTTFSENFFQDNDCSPEIVESNSQFQESFENQGGYAGGKNAETLSTKELEGVTTSVSPPQDLTDDDIEEFRNFIRTAIADPDPQVAAAAQEFLAGTLTDAKDKARVWAVLTNEEKLAFKAALKSLNSESPSSQFKVGDRCVINSTGDKVVVVGITSKTVRVKYLQESPGLNEINVIPTCLKLEQQLDLGLSIKPNSDIDGNPKGRTLK